MNPFELTKKIDAQPARPASPRSSGGKAAVPPDHLAAMVRGVSNTVVGNDADTWMSPNQPLAPQEPQVKGRQFDFAVGENLRFRPRSGDTTSFIQLRALAETYDLLRLVIETRKDQLVRNDWNVVPVDPEKDADDRCLEMEAFLRQPNRINDWQTWLRAIAEEVLVTDAVCIYPRMTRGGGVYSLDLMDGATMKVIIDESGRQPPAPMVAYQQILKGLPAVNYSADELIYAPRNVRVNRLYGYPPVEQVIMTVNIAIRRQLSQLQAYTEGNIPEAIASVPASWNSAMIADFQKYWDSLLEGNMAARRHMKFVPDGMKYYPTIQEMLKDPFDEWLARVICFAFSISPAAFMREMNRATAQTSQESSLEEGLGPLMRWFKMLLTRIIQRYFGFKDLQFSWKDEEPANPLIAAQVNDIYIKNATKSVDEVRQKLGMDPIGMTNAVWGTAPTMVADVLNPPEPVLPMAPGGAAPPSGKGAVKGRAPEPAKGTTKQQPRPPGSPAASTAKKIDGDERDERNIHVNITMPPVRGPDVLVDNHIHLKE